MANAAVSGFTKETAAKWLANLGVACSGTKEELISRIKTFKKYPKLVSKLQKRAQRNFKFSCSLEVVVTKKLRGNEKKIHFFIMR